MLTESVEHVILQLSGQIDLRSGSSKIDLDDLQKLDAANLSARPTPETPSTATPFIEVRMQITVTGLPFEVPNPSNNLPNFLVPGVAERFEIERAWIDDQLKAEARRLAALHFGFADWVLIDAKASLGSFIQTIIYAVPVVSTVAMYADLKASVPMLFNDLFVEAPRFVARISRKLLGFEREALFSPATAGQTTQAVGEDVVLSELRRMNGLLEAQGAKIAALEGGREASGKGPLQDTSSPTERATPTEQPTWVVDAPEGPRQDISSPRTKRAPPPQTDH